MQLTPITADPQATYIAALDRLSDEVSRLRAYAHVVNGKRTERTEAHELSVMEAMEAALGVDLSDDKAAILEEWGCDAEGYPLTDGGDRDYGADRVWVSLADRWGARA